MSVKSKSALHLVFLIALLVVAILIVRYFWSTDTLDGIRRLPMGIMVLSLIYVLLQIAKRVFLKTNNWWDWLYYIGLISMMLPTFFVTSSNYQTLSWVTDYGSLFLIVPILFGFKSLLKTSK